MRLLLIQGHHCNSWLRETEVTQRIQLTIIIHGWVKNAEKIEIIKTFVLLFSKTIFPLEMKSFACHFCSLQTTSSSFFQHSELKKKTKPNQIQPGKIKDHNLKPSVWIIFLNKLFLNSECLHAEILYMSVSEQQNTRILLSTCTYCSTSTRACLGNKKLVTIYNKYT